MKYLKSFNNASEYNVFVASVEYILPNVSRIIAEDIVEYNPVLPTYVTFSFDQVLDWVGTTEVIEFTVPTGTTFAEWMEMEDEYGFLNKYAVIAGYGEWFIKDSGEMCSEYAMLGIGGGGVGTEYSYLLNTDGSRVKGTDVIEARHYDYEVVQE